MKKDGKSSWGGKREGSGRKPQNDYTIREQFKKAFDKVVTQDEWEKFVRDSWNGTWKQKKYLIEQRIGKASQTKIIEDDSPSDVLKILREVLDEPDVL